MAQVLKSKNGQKWIVRFYYKGVKYSVQKPSLIGYDDEYWSTNAISETKMKKLAPIVEDKYITYLKQENNTSKKENQPLSRVIQDFLNYQETIVKSQTWENYRITSKFILNYFGKDTPISECITTEKLIKFRSYLGTRNNTEATKNIVLTRTTAFLNFLAMEEIISYETLGKSKQVLKKFKVTSKLVRDEDYWTPEEFDKFISTFDDNKPLEYIYKVAFQTTYWCGLRMGELLGLMPEDFDFNKNLVTISRQKDTQHRIANLKTSESHATINVRSEVAKNIQKVINMEVGEKYIFPLSRESIRRIMGKHAEKAGIKKIVFHGLRRSIASRMIQSGVNILFVSKHLRHDSPNTTMKAYATLFPNTDKDSIENL